MPLLQSPVVLWWLLPSMLLLLPLLASERPLRHLRLQDLTASREYCTCTSLRYYYFTLMYIYSNRMSS